jgi:hypothetical protein
MNQFLDVLAKFLQDHWVEVGLSLVFAGFGWFFGRRRERAKWTKREFYDRLNVSLNIIENGKLRIRTLLEKPCEEVFLSKAASEDVIAAAAKTTAEDAILPLKEDEYWFYLNPVLNEISEKYSAGFIKAEMKQPVVKETFIVCLTCEAAGTIRQRKIRAMVIKKSLLLALPEFTSEREGHSTRVKTIQQMARDLKTHPAKFIEVEIVL